MRTRDSARIHALNRPPNRGQAEPYGSVAPDRSRGVEPHYRPPQFALRELAVDALMLIVAAGASILSARATGVPDVSVGWLAAFSVGALLVLGYQGVYRPHFAPRLLEEIRAIVAATAISAMAVTFARELLGSNPDIASQAVRAWLFATVYLAAGRVGIHHTKIRRRRQGLGGERTLIIGAGRVGHLVANRLEERPEFGLKPVAFLDPDPLTVRDPADLPVVGDELRDSADPEAYAATLETAVRERGVRHVIVAFSLSSHEVELAMVRRCQELRVSVSLVPRLFGGLPDQLDLERIGGLPLVTVHPVDPRGWQFAIKYGVDRVFAAFGIVLLSPLLLATAAAIWITMGRPILFRQRRVGLDQREFEMLKFRTMIPGPSGNAPDASSIEEGTAVGPGGIEGSDRRTRLGRFLRASSIDELPQLFNVLRGEMSLVGPRPERPEFSHVFDRRVHRYADRSRVKSGITGWAQVHGLRGKTSLEDRAEWDNYYIENWSLWLDLRTVMRTFLVVFRDRAE